MSEQRFRFIPYRKSDIIEMCLEEGLPANSAGDFRNLANTIGHIFHFEFHKSAELLKALYAPMDPDRDTRYYKKSESEEAHTFVDQLELLLEKANYEQISETELKRALCESSLFKIRLEVDFDDFSEVLLFCRGESVKKERVKSWMGLASKEIEFINYDRVVLYIRYSDDYDASKDPLSTSRPGSTFLKLFQNVPQADLEMLFPNTHVKMRLIDKLLIGIPAAISGGIVLSTKMGASLVLLGSLIGFWLGFSAQPVEFNTAALIALLAGFFALGGYLWKQFNNFKNRKLRFMQTLTQNLYFKNLDNNAGVFHRLVNDAEEEECKEAVLAYYFLLTNDVSLTKKELDGRIEMWFEKEWDCQIDFEIDDALQKLERMGLVEVSAERLSAIPVDTAQQKLEQQWKGYLDLM